MRPIVAGPSCVTSRLSNFLDILLKPDLNHVKCYVKGSVDFLNKLPKESHEKEVLITLDVTNMYTNIDHNFAVEAIDFWLFTRPECLPRNIKGIRSRSFVNCFRIQHFHLQWKILFTNTETFDEK